MVVLEENFKWHLEAFASELFIYIYQKLLVNLAHGILKFPQGLISRFKSLAIHLVNCSAN